MFDNWNFTQVQSFYLKSEPLLLCPWVIVLGFSRTCDYYGEQLTSTTPNAAGGQRRMLRTELTDTWWSRTNCAGSWQHLTGATDPGYILSAVSTQHLVVYFKRKSGDLHSNHPSACTTKCILEFSGQNCSCFNSEFWVVNLCRNLFKLDNITSKLKLKPK